MIAASLLLGAHVGALAVWLLAQAAGHVAHSRALAAPSPGSALRQRWRALRLSGARHGAALATVVAGLALMELRGWGFGYPRWLALKLGLSLFLLLPLEAMHAWICWWWIRPGLVEEASGAASKRLARGLGMEEMLRMLALPLLGTSVPLLLWLSLAKPF